MTLSTTDRSMSGMTTVISVVPSDTPKAMNTFLLCRARNGHSRRQLPLHVARPRRGSGCAPFVAALVERVAQRAEAAVHRLGIVDPPDQIVEDDAHRRVGRGRARRDPTR